MQHLLDNQSVHSHYSYAQQQQQLDVGDDEYNRLLKNYKLAHIRVEEQRLQMLEQEKQNALLRKHIGLLQGAESSAASVIGGHAGGGGGTTVDDVSTSPSTPFELSSMAENFTRCSSRSRILHLR